MLFQSGIVSSAAGSTIAAGAKARPLFVTTVPTGVYLPAVPSRELPVRRTYSYFSVPRILAGMPSAAATAAKAVPPKGGVSRPAPSSVTGKSFRRYLFGLVGL